MTDINKRYRVNKQGMIVEEIDESSVDYEDIPTRYASGKTMLIDKIRNRIKNGVIIKKIFGLAFSDDIS